MTRDEAIENAHRIYAQAWLDEHPPEEQQLAA